MTLHEQADQHLAKIAELTGRIELREKTFEREVQELRGLYQPEQEKLKKELAIEANNLLTLMKKNKSDLFEKKEKVVLPHGMLIHTIASKLTLPKNAVDRIEEMGWNEAIKIAKNVDREMVEKWPIERIIAIGGDKKPKEKFEYELKKD